MKACPYCDETFTDSKRRNGPTAGDRLADHLTDAHDAYTRAATIEVDP